MNRPGQLLIVDDEALYRQLLTERLARAGFAVTEAEDGNAALAYAEQNEVDVALVDIKMPGMDGIELLRRLKELDPHMEVVILTGHGNVDTAISAMKLGAFDYLSKPYKLSELDLVVQRALEKRRLTRRVAGLAAEVSHLRDRTNGPDPVGVGKSAAWQQALALVKKAAPLDIPVLITGESGAGKEVIANALHRWSARAADSFVPLNCGLLQENLLESELFGHKKGAFTSAVNDKEGLFQTAANGTLFLDEIGELPAASQAKLLRVLDTGEYRAMGSTQLRRTNARVVAATHRNLDRQVQDGVFRHDLYYRLNVLHIKVPALRERPEDIPLLVEHFMRRGPVVSQALPRITPRALRLLMDYDWPGNVRELRNVVERVLVLNDGDTLDEGIIASVLSIPGGRLPPRAVPAAEFQRPERVVALEDMERDYVAWALEQCQGNVSAAAAELKVSRSTIYRILKTEQATEAK